MHQGPKLVTACTRKYCNLTKKDGGEANPHLEGDFCIPNRQFVPRKNGKTTRDGAAGFSILDRKTAYGVAYGRWKMFFEERDSDVVEALTRDRGPIQ